MLTAVPVANKRKSADLCRAFVTGAPSDVHGFVYFGVDRSNRSQWLQAKRDGVPRWYIDNSYFDRARGTLYRVSKNRLQCTGLGVSDCKRFDALGIRIEPWREPRSQVVLLCPQSTAFHEDVLGGLGSDWMPRVIEALTAANLAPRVRAWNRDKSMLAASIHVDLHDARALVTWSSAAAVTAVLAGVPIVTLGQSAAEPMAGSLLELLEGRLPRPDNRREWCGVLADQQFTMNEMRNGTAWRMLSEREAVSA